MAESMIERGTRVVIVLTIPAYAYDDHWGAAWVWYLKGRGKGGEADCSAIAVAERQFRAAVEAIREATVEMSSEGQRVIDAGDAAWPSDAVWQTMIDAIFNEGSHDDG